MEDVPSNRPYIPALKIYDLDLAEEKPREYWDRRMGPVYFQDPKQFVGRMINSPVYQFLLEFLPQKGLLLDGGCGFNYWAKIFNTEEREIIGLDFATENLFKGRQFFPQGISLGGDLNNLPFASESFDGVISVSTAEHIEMGPQKLFKESYRILKNKGYFLLILPTYNWEDLFFSSLAWPFLKKKQGLAAIPHFSGTKYFKKVKEVRREKANNFFAYWINQRTIKKLLKSQGFLIKKTRYMDILGGLARSHLFGAFGKNLMAQFPISSRRISPKNLSWTERLFFQESNKRMSPAGVLQNCTSFFYHYLVGFVAQKNK